MVPRSSICITDYLINFEFLLRFSAIYIGFCNHLLHCAVAAHFFVCRYLYWRATNPQGILDAILLRCYLWNCLFLGSPSDSPPGTFCATTSIKNSGCFAAFIIIVYHKSAFPFGWFSFTVTRFAMPEIGMHSARCARMMISPAILRFLWRLSDTQKAYIMVLRELPVNSNVEVVSLPDNTILLFWG